MTDYLNANYSLNYSCLSGNCRQRSLYSCCPRCIGLGRNYDHTIRLFVHQNRIQLFFANRTDAQRRSFVLSVPTYQKFHAACNFSLSKRLRQRIPLLAVSGYDADALIEEQRSFRSNEDDRIFHYSSKSASTAFTRACAELKIEDLHFHDLRHEGTSRLFEAGFAIQQVALVTGHKDWKMLRRYTHLKPETLHAAVDSKVA